MLTDKHLAILRELRHDARISLAEVGRKTTIPTSTVFDYYQEMDGKEIVRHVALPDFGKLGYALRKKFLLRTGDRTKAWQWLKAHPAVNNIYRIDSHDAFFEAYFSSVNDSEEFRSALKHDLKPKEFKEFDVLEELKHEAFTPQIPTERTQ